MIERLTSQRSLFWPPAWLVGSVAWLVFVLIGQTPVIRASGLALVVVGMALALRSMGAPLAIIGGMALALSPSFWIQTGGSKSQSAGSWWRADWRSGHCRSSDLVQQTWPFLGAAAGLILFTILFLSAIGTPRSLRLTTLLTAWTLYLLVDGLLVSNPRPDQPSNGALGTHHTYGLLLLLLIGVINDPMFVLLAPAIALGLFLSRKHLPVWYWAALVAILGFGIYGISQTYYSPYWWNLPVEQAISLPNAVPYLVATVWREPERWIRLMALISSQFTLPGLALGILGLARLSRWHPPVGVVTMIAYGTYALFGLIYFGQDSPVLLLPLLMIQLLWMTYAVYTFSQWLQKSVKPARIQWVATAAFTLLPLLMLLRIVGML